MRSDWPKHLYESRGYYTYRHPVTGKGYGLGRDLAYAMEQANQANAAIDGQSLLRKLEERKTLGEFLTIYETHLDTLNLRPRSRYCIRSSLKAIRSALSDLEIGTRYEDAPAMSGRCFAFLKTYVDRNKLRMAKQVRTTLIDVFACMISRGWIAVNPCRDLKLPAPTVKRQRLTLDDWTAIHAQSPAWLQRAMELALVTLQRREDVANMRFRDVSQGYLQVNQQKTDARLRIPMGIELNGLTLDGVIRSCRDMVTPYMVHHPRTHGKATAGDRVHPQTIAREFAAIRDKVGIQTQAGKTPPTFHEIRSLGIRLYKARGYNPQDLAGHKQSTTTDIYADDRGAEWVTVKA